MLAFLQKQIPSSRRTTDIYLNVFLPTALSFTCLLSFKPFIFLEMIFFDQVKLAFVMSAIVLFVIYLKYRLIYKKVSLGLWTLKHDLVSLFFALLSITALFLALSPLVVKSWLKHPIEMNGEYVVVTTGFVFLVGILLYLVSISLHFILAPSVNSGYNTNVSSQTDEVKLNNHSKLTEIILEGKNQGERLCTPRENLICVSTNGHYVDIFLVDSNNSSKKIVFRNSIVAVADSLKEYDEFIQCHRSHLINMNHVEHLIGGSKKMEVRLKNFESKLPVSRTKSAVLVEKLKNQDN